MIKLLDNIKNNIKYNSIHHIFLIVNFPVLIYECLIYLQLDISFTEFELQIDCDIYTF